MVTTTAAPAARHVARRTLLVLLVAVGCGTLTASVFVGLRPFFWSAPENFDPTFLYLALLVAVGSTLVVHVALSPVDETADAGWLLAVAVIAGAPALVYTVVMLGLPFLFALERGWMAVSFVPILPVVAGPALGVGIAACYLMRAEETTRHRRVISVAILFTATAAIQLVLLVVTRNGELFFGG